jgi:hypothetical protein
MNRKAGRVYVGMGLWNYAPWRDSSYPAGPPHKRVFEYANQLTSIKNRRRRLPNAKRDGFLYVISGGATPTPPWR